MELLIRASRNDHTMIEKLCAPASAGLWTTRRLPLSGLVADASVAAERAQLSKLAATAGIPYLIDPVTPLLQDEQAPDHPGPGCPSQPRSGIHLPNSSTRTCRTNSSSGRWTSSVSTGRPCSSLPTSIRPSVATTGSR